MDAMFLMKASLSLWVVSGVVGAACEARVDSKEVLELFSADSMASFSNLSGSMVY